MQSYLRAPAKVAPQARVTRAERLVADGSAKREVRVCKRGEWDTIGLLEGGGTSRRRSARGTVIYEPDLVSVVVGSTGA
jgi:hypothetical protein